MTYLPTFCKFQVFRKLMQCVPSIRKISFRENAEILRPKYKKRHKSASLILPQLTFQRIQEIESVTGIIVGLNYISWAKMSVSNLYLLEWNVEVLPYDFQNQVEEVTILNFAYDVRNALSDSDLYVMETFPVKESKQYIVLNKICLSSMLTILLNGYNTDLDWKEKVIFQKKFVMNYLYNIQIANERISTRSIVENILLKSTHLSNFDVSDIPPAEYPSITVDYEYVKNYKQSDFEKQENMSLALLLTLSFIDVNLFKNEKSLKKIQNRKI